MTTDTFVKAQLALLCWRNAPAGKPFVLLKTLALIERNRQRAGWHGGSWLEIIASDAVYSPYLPGEATEPVYPDLRDDIFQRFLWEVDRIYDGTAGDPMTEGALWWAELDRINRPWFREKIAQSNADHPRVAQVGPLTLWH